MRPDLGVTIDAITGQHRRRTFAMEQRKRANLALASMLRMALGWSRALPDDERKVINDHALALIKLGEQESKALAKGKEFATDEPDYHEWRDVILAAIQSRAPFDAVEKAAKKEMARLAETLPVWEAFAKDIRGFGPESLAVIVAEAGDLSNYPPPGKPVHKGKGMLWKRMGLAVLDGVRQGGLSKTAAKDDWIAHGYNRQRRSRMWNIGDTLMKAQVRKVKDADGNDTGERVPVGFYGAYYLDRKRIEREKAEAKGLTVCPSAKIPAKRAAEFMSDGHIHRRAQRKMEIRLLTDLWRAWRRDTAQLPERARSGVPAADVTPEAVAELRERAKPEMDADEWDVIEETAHAAH